MSSEIKSGAETLQQFFADLASDESIDADTKAILANLFDEGKLTTTNVANALRDKREGQLSDQD